MENRSKKFTAAKFILMGCAVLLALVVGTYAWQVSKPTGFERLPKVATLKAKSALRKQKPVIVNTPQQPAKAPVIPPPPLEKKSPLPLSANSFYTVGNLSGLNQTVMSPSPAWWIPVVRDSEKGTGRIPDDQLQWLQENVPGILRSWETPKELQVTVPDLVAKLENRFSKSEGWEEPTAQAAYYIQGGLQTINLAAITAVASAARGDGPKANEKMQELLTLAGKLYPVSLGNSPMLTEFLIGMDANDMLTSETLAMAARIAEDNFSSQAEYDEQRKANIRAVTESISADAENWSLDDSIGTYFLNGVPSKMIRMALIPAAQKSLESYAVAVAERNLQEIATARRDLDQKFFLMNVKMPLNLEQLQNEDGEVYQFGFPNGIYTGPRPEMDHARAGLAQMNHAAYRSRFVLACLQYRQQRGDWPSTYDDVEKFLPVNFREETGSDWVPMRSREISYYRPREIKNPLLVDQYKTSTGVFPTTARQLANFAGMADEEPLKELFGSRTFALILVEVRRHPVYDWNGEKIYDPVGSDGEAIDSKFAGAKQLDQQMIQTSFFFIPTREEIRSKTAMLVGDKEEKH